MFQFKQFVIQQGRTPMKVGTDGVLLGAWADVDRAKAVLDIGTGTGLIALMGAQRNHSALVHAIEIEPSTGKHTKQPLGKPDTTISVCFTKLFSGNTL